jgi:Protein of unknown function (DUF3617)
MRKGFSAESGLGLRVGGLVAVAVIAVAATAGAHELPAFKKGNWSFERTVDDPAHPGTPQTISTQKCTDPTADWKRQNAKLTQIGCRFSAGEKDGNRYTFLAHCRIQGRDGNTTNAHNTTVITVESDEAYSLTIDGEVNGVATHEKLAAKRLGDC